MNRPIFLTRAQRAAQVARRTWPLPLFVLGLFAFIGAMMGWGF